MTLLTLRDFIHQSSSQFDLTYHCVGGTNKKSGRYVENDYMLINDKRIFHISSSDLEEISKNFVDLTFSFLNKKTYNFNTFTLKSGEELFAKLYKKLIKINAKQNNLKEVEVIAKLQSKEYDFKLQNLIYPTNYGFGYFCIFFDKERFDNLNNQIGNELKRLGVEYSNEYSDKNWVYRFLISKDKDYNIDILEKIHHIVGNLLDN